MDVIKIYNGSTLVRSIDSVIDASFRDSLNGEMTFSFTTEAKRISGIKEGFRVEFQGQFYTLARLRKSSGGMMVYSVDCEHISFLLNDDDYMLESFVFFGAPSDALQILLAGTSLQVGTVEPNVHISVSFKNKVSRRKAVMQVIALCGGEIEYNGYSINVRSHRGSTSRKRLTRENQMSRVGETSDFRAGTVSQELEFLRDSGLKIGDEITIDFPPLEIFAQTRIVAVEYNPFNTVSVLATVGDYIPELLDMYTETENRFSDFDSQMGDYDERLTEAESELEDKPTKSEVNASISTYVNSEAGTASIIAACTGVFASVDDITGFKTETQVKAIISSEINQTGGSIKMFVEGKNYVTQTSADSTYLKSTQLNAGISSYVDTSAGTAKIISACSGTYQTKDAMSGYATTTYVTNSITQEVSPLESKISLVVGNGKMVDANGNANASVIISAINGSSSASISADRVNLSGYVTISSLGSAGAVTINGGNITANSLDIGTIKNTYISGTTSGVSFPSGIASPYIYTPNIYPLTGDTVGIGLVGKTVALRGTVTVNGNELVTTGSMSGYATQSWVTGNFSSSGHTHSNYVTTTAISSYATQSWVTTTALSGYAAQSWVTANYATAGHSHSNYVTTTALSGYATQSWVSTNYATAGHSHSGMITTSNIGLYAVTSLAGYATQSWVSSYYASSGHTHSNLYASVNHSHSYASASHYHTVTIGSSSYNTGSPR